MDQDEFVDKIPFAYHTTPRRHVDLIRCDMVLYSAKELVIQAEGAYTPGPPRANPRELCFPDGSVRVLRDQEPLLRPGQVALEPGFTIKALVELIDSHVLFWPALDGGRSKSSKYQDEERAILRVPTADLFRENPLPFFCKYNSGAGRATDGRGSPRGPKLFVGPGAFRGPVSAVREIAFRRRAVLPPSTTVSFGAAGPWELLAPQ